MLIRGLLFFKIIPSMYVLIFPAVYLNLQDCSTKILFETLCKHFSPTHHIGTYCDEFGKNVICLKGH